MTLRISKELEEAETKWVGKRVKYWILDVLDKKSHGRKLDGPYYGIVTSLTNNGSLVEDRLEGNTYRSFVKFTGQLIVQPDHRIEEDYPSYIHAEIIQD